MRPSFLGFTEAGGIFTAFSGTDKLEKNAHSVPTLSAWPLLNQEVAAALLVGKRSVQSCWWGEWSPSPYPQACPQKRCASQWNLARNTHPSC